MKHKLLSVIWLTAALALQMFTPFAVYAVYIDRGYFAIGGEWIMPLLAAIFVYLGICEILITIKQERG